MRTRVYRIAMVVAVTVVAAGWLIESRAFAQDDGRGCVAPSSWGDLKGSAAVTATAVALTFEDENRTVRVARGETKGNCRLLLTVTRE